MQVQSWVEPELRHWLWPRFAVGLNLGTKVQKWVKIDRMWSSMERCQKGAKSDIHCQLLKAVRSVHVFKEIAKELRSQVQAVLGEDKGTDKMIQGDNG